MHVLSPARRRPLVVLTAAALAATALQLTGAPAAAQTTTFPDVPSANVHAEAISLVADAGVAQGSTDGTYRPRLDVRRDQMATFLTNGLGLGLTAPSFPDVDPNGPHGGAIGAIDRAGITGGYADGTYRPLAPINRGQMAAFLARALDLPAGNATFPDVDPAYVHADAIAAVASAGIADGFPDGNYRPNAPVKRDQMATFIARGVGLDRDPYAVCPGAETSSASAAAAGDPSPSTTDDGALDAATERSSEDLDEATGMTTDTADDGAVGAANVPDREILGPGVEGLPLTSALRTTSGIEIHSQDLATSRGARIDDAGNAGPTTTIPDGTRTWATTQLGNRVYVGQWGTSGATNLFSYPVAGSGDRRATGVAAVPTGGEFWTLAADGRNDRLWAGTRAHAQGAFRAEVGMGTANRDGRHVVHRIDPSSGQVDNVFVCLPNLPSSERLRPDVKQLAVHDGTLYLALGQQAGGSRLYAVEPGDRTRILARDVTDLTPHTNVANGNGIFALEVSDRWIALGTQASSGREPRLVVLDRASGQTRINVALPGGSRVDAVALRANHVAATTLDTLDGGDANIVDLEIPTSGSVRGNVADQARTSNPVPGEFHRFVEITPDGLRGVSNQATLWTVDDAATRITPLVGRPRVPFGPVLPHSLHVGNGTAITGASSVATLRDLADPDELRRISVSGEVKASTTAPDGRAFLATYPNARLWTVAPGSDEAEELRGWSSDFLRPADAAYDDRADRVLVVARDDNNPQAEERPGSWPNRQIRPSRLFTIAAGVPSDEELPGHELTRTGGHPVEATTVLPADDSTDAFVGDTRGGVQRVDVTTGAQDWYDPGDLDRDVVAMRLTEDGLVVVSSGNRDGASPAIRTLLRVIDPATGQVTARRVLSDTWAIGDAVITGDLVVMPSSRTRLRWFDRAADTFRPSTTHDTNDSFGGPYLALDEDTCRFYQFEGTARNLVRFEPAVGECGQADGGDPGDPDDGGDVPDPEVSTPDDTPQG